MRRPRFHIGQHVHRASLEPFELDMLALKLGSATGKNTRYWTQEYNYCDGFNYKYEVLWQWRSGETSLGHYNERQLVANVQRRS